MAKGILPEGEWIECLRGHPELAGVFVGGCVARGVGSSFRAAAHAHSHVTDANRGWICVRAERKACIPAMMIHELAHVIARSGHTDKWRAKVIELGGTIDAVPGLMRSYRKVKRGR